MENAKLGKPNYRAKCKKTYKLGEKMVKKNGFKFYWERLLVATSEGGGDLISPILLDSRIEIVESSFGLSTN